MTVASVNVNFTLALGQHFTADEAEGHFTATIDRLKQAGMIPTIVEIDILPGTQTKSVSFEPTPLVDIRPHLSMVGARD